MNVDPTVKFICCVLQSRVETGYVDKEQLADVKKEIEARYRADLNKKLEDVNMYLENQAMSREKMETSIDETRVGLREKNKKLQVFILSNSLIKLFSNSMLKRKYLNKPSFIRQSHYNILYLTGR